jgi:hypothetical protein
VRRRSPTANCIELAKEALEPKCVRQILDPFSQHLTRRGDRLAMSLVASRKLDPLMVRQVFAIVNVEEVVWHVGVHSISIPDGLN